MPPRLFLKPQTASKQGADREKSETRLNYANFRLTDVRPTTLGALGSLTFPPVGERGRSVYAPNHSLMFQQGFKPAHCKGLKGT
jgi:hypothetical protein